MKGNPLKDKKLIRLGIAALIAILLCVVCFSEAFAAPSKIPSWPPVCEERMTDGVWSAYAIGEVNMGTPIIPGKTELRMKNGKGEWMRVRVKEIFHPKTLSGPTSPGRIWVNIENLTMAPGQPQLAPAVIHTVW